MKPIKNAFTNRVYNTRSYAILSEHIERSRMNSKSGDNGPCETPLPISNRTVKTRSADGTAGVALWESRELPG